MGVLKRCFTSTASSIVFESFKITKHSLEVNLKDIKKGTSTLSTFDFIWLLDNCASLKDVGNQKQFRNVESLLNVTAKSAELSDKNDEIHINWSENSPYTKSSLFSASTLLELSSNKSRELDFRNLNAEGNLGNKEVPKFNFSDLMDRFDYNSVNRSTLFKVGDKLNKFGIVLLKDVPKEDRMVLKIANLFGESSNKIYGEHFNVKADVNPINVAYTSKALEFHQDLAYFESPPGLQYLHAMEFSSQVVGGESTFINSLPLAEEFKKNFSHHFRVLTKVPATFHKIRKTDSFEDSLRMVYQRPHIVVNHLDEIISVFWSPPFEGPLKIADDDSELSVREYYKAYAAFQSFINSEEMFSKYGTSFRLNERELIIFNNRKILHGRNSFTQPQGTTMKRHLQGCYTSLDEFLNKFRLLEEEFGEKGKSNEIRQGILNYK